MYVILIKIDTKTALPSAKKAKNGLFQLSTHPRAENEKFPASAKRPKIAKNDR